MRKIRIIDMIYACTVVMCCLLYGCADESLEGEKQDYSTQTQNILFYGTYEIPLEITSDVSQPSFAWEATGLKYIVITIFNSKIDLSQEQIANPQNAVWTWNTGMGRGREGNISFSDGRDILNGETLETVSPLKSGIYYIAAWGYDDNYNLTHSSKEYEYNLE